MLSLIKNKVQILWKPDNHERSLKIKKNIFYIFFIKGGSVLISLMLVPLTIHYVNPVIYGIWLTIGSIAGWINNFDVGLSNGLRNELATSLALGDTSHIRKYVSTTYAMLFILSAGMFFVFFIAGSFFNWNTLLNINSSIHLNIWPVILITLGAFCIQFSLQPINTILIATQQPFKSSLLLFLGQVATLAFVFILTISVQANLTTLVIVMSGSPLLVMLAANIYLFVTSLKDFAPKISFVHLKSAKSLLKIGGIFFVIQLGALVLYQTDNIIVAKTMGPQQVTTFNIAYKIFSILVLAFSIIVTPYWSAFTDAYTKKDFDWIKQSLKKMKIVWLCFSIAAILMYLASDFLYRLWIGRSIQVPNILSLAMAGYVIVVNWYLIQTFALNGIGKLRIQLIFIVAAGIINIPLSIWLINRVGICGTVIANIIVIVIMNIAFTHQIKLLINNKAKGIWNK